MNGRDQEFQDELRRRELAAKNGAAEQSARAQAMAAALANRTLTEVTLQGVEVFLFRMVNDEDEFQGVTLMFLDRAFNKRYSYTMDATNVEGFSKDLLAVIAGGEELEEATKEPNLDV